MTEWELVMSFYCCKLLCLCVFYLTSQNYLLERNAMTVSLQKVFTWKMTVSLTNTDFLVDQEGQPMVSCCPPARFNQRSQLLMSSLLRKVSFKEVI